MTSRKEILQTFKLSLTIAIIIFAIGVLSEISVKVAFSGADIITGVLLDLFGILLITGVLMLLFLGSPKYKKRLARIFGPDK